VLSELRTLSEHDALTGAVNRRHMMDLLNEELKRQRRAHRPFSVAMVDIDFSNVSMTAMATRWVIWCLKNWWR
jgi:PleD family two-component response regulator